MTDALLHQPPSHSDSSCSPKTSTQLEETIERCIGDFGWKQFIQASLISMSWAFDAQQTFISVFTDAQQTWHCNTNTTTTGTRCNITTNLCLLPKADDASWSWDLPSYTSTVSEWSLQCAGSFITGLPTSSFFVGCLAGGFLLATLADSLLGKKKSLVLSCLLMSLSGMLTAASTNIWMYSALRFLYGFGRATVGTSALVLASEIVGKRWR